MLTYYAYDSQAIYTNPVEFDPYEPIPPNSTPIAPPALTVTEVAQLQSDGWVILSERPPEPPAPEPTPAPEPAPVPLNKIDFLRLFLQGERIAIREAAKVNPIIADYQDMLDAAGVVLLTDSDIVAGVPLLEQAGLLGAGRAVKILAGEAPE